MHIFFIAGEIGILWIGDEVLGQLCDDFRHDEFEVAWRLVGEHVGF